MAYLRFVHYGSKRDGIVTKLDELKEYLRLKRENGTSGAVFTSTEGEILIQIAEAAFEMPEPMDRVLGVCLFCESDQSGIFTPPIPHKPDCLYQRIQDLKKELQ